MKQLEELDLSGNDFEGALDICLGNFTSLRTLDLSNNFLSGSIPTPLIVSLSLLEYISFANNKFEGLFSLNIFANHSKLKVLRLGYMDSQTFQVETENPLWVASFQLEDLQLPYCQVNLPTKTIPTFLSSQKCLRSIDLSGNNLAGMFPNWLLLNNRKLEYVVLKENSFIGPFQIPFDPRAQMRELSISDNQIQGELPQNIGFFFPNLERLLISNNGFVGHIPASIGEMPSLKALDLKNNNFSGKVPDSIFIGCISLVQLIMDNNQLNGTLSSSIGNSKLSLLAASRNNFEGPITNEICQLDLHVLDLSQNKLSVVVPSCLNMKSATVICLRGNSFTGTIPEPLVNSSNMLIIDLRDNNFTGSIPESIYGLESLTFLLLAGNKLQGQLSNKICQLRYVHILDLSRNNFTGPIPPCLNNISFALLSSTSWSLFMYETSMEDLQVMTKGLSLSYEGDVLKNMSSLDLSCNQFTGEIPYQMGDLQGLHSLNSSHNHLNGSIPESFHKLERIESLDLSDNSLSGQIPFQLQGLHSLSFFNVSYNNLSGIAPNNGQFGTFDESSYKGNPFLSWSNSNRRIIAPPPPPTPLDEAKKGDSAIDFTSFYWSFVASYVTMLLSLVTVLWINPYWRRTWFHYVKRCLLICMQILGLD